MNNELCIQLLQKDSSVLGQGKETLFVVLKYQRFLFDWRKSWIPKLIKFQVNQIKTIQMNYNFLWLLPHPRLLSISNHCEWFVSVPTRFPSGSESKAAACSAGRPGLEPCVRNILWRRKWQPTPVPLPGKSHGQRSPVGYSPWDRKQSDTTEVFHFQPFCIHLLLPMHIYMCVYNAHKNIQNIYVCI